MAGKSTEAEAKRGTTLQHNQSGCPCTITVGMTGCDCCGWITEPGPDMSLH